MKKLIAFLLACIVSMQVYAQVVRPVDPKQVQTKPSPPPKVVGVVRNINALTFRPFTGAQPLAVTITTTPSFPESKKMPGEQKPVSGCMVTPLQYQMSTDVINTFFISSGKETNIYPGAIYKAVDVTSETFRPYHLEYTRSPMDLNTSIFTNNSTARNNMVINGNEFDYGTINNKWTTMLRNNIQGNTPGKLKHWRMVVESANQLKTDVVSTSQVDVSAKIGVEVPSIPVSVGVDNKTSVSNSSVSSSTVSNSKSTIVLKHEQIFYSASITPKAGYADFFTSKPNSELEDDLVYIKSVDYGMIYYITITSSASKSDLFKAVTTAVSTQTGVSATFPVQGVPVNAEVGVGTSNTNMSSQQATNILNSSEIKVYQWGGETMPLSGDINSILTQLEQRTKFSATNLGAPISYTLGFVKDGANAWMNFDSRYASVNCPNNTAGYKYDVKVRLDHLKVNKITWGWDNIYGDVVLTYGMAGNKEYHEDKIIKHISKIEVHEGDKISNVSNEVALFTGLTYEEVTNLKVYVKARLYDDRESDVFTCTMCDSKLANDYYRRARIFNSNSENYIEAIGKLVATPKNAPKVFTAIKLDSDKYFGHTMKRADSNIEVMLQLLVSAYE